MSDSVVPKPKKQFTDLPESEQREIILGAVKDSNEEQRKIMDSVLPTSTQPNFEVDLDKQRGSTNWEGNGAFRLFSITVSHESDEQIAEQFEHELEKFIDEFCVDNQAKADNKAYAESVATKVQDGIKDFVEGVS